MLEEQSAAAVADEDRHTLTLIVSLTVPGFIEIVTVLEVMAGVRDDVVQTPEPEPTPWTWWQVKAPEPSPANDTFRAPKC